METLDSLYDAIVEDLKRENFAVSEKYRAKNEELGKYFYHASPLHSFYFFFSSLHFLNYKSHRMLNRVNSTLKG